MSHTYGLEHRLMEELRHHIRNDKVLRQKVADAYSSHHMKQLIKIRLREIEGHKENDSCIEIYAPESCEVKE